LAQECAIFLGLISLKPAQDLWSHSDRDGLAQECAIFLGLISPKPAQDLWSHVAQEFAVFTVSSMYKAD